MTAFYAPAPSRQAARDDRILGYGTGHGGVELLEAGWPDDSFDAGGKLEIIYMQEMDGHNIETLEGDRKTG